MSISVGSTFIHEGPPVESVDVYPDSEEEEFDEVDEGDEVDQLESDTDPATGTSASVPRPRKPSLANKRSPKVKRKLGQTLLPLTRVEDIIQADGVAAGVSMSKEAVYTMAVATEDFIKRLALAGNRQSSAANRSSIEYLDMASTTQQYREFMFLRETIPVPIPFSKALQLREAKEKEAVANDPALASHTPFEFVQNESTQSVAGASTAAKNKAKSRTTNGHGHVKEKTNGISTPASTPGTVAWGYDDGRGQSILDARPWLNWTTSAPPPHVPRDQPHMPPQQTIHHHDVPLAPEAPLELHANGYSTSAPSESQPSSAIPTPPIYREQDSIEPSPSYSREERAPQNTFASFATSGVDNPGRTIYSKQE